MSVMADSGMKTRSLLGLTIAETQRKQALDVIIGRFKSSEQTLVVFANTNLLSSLRKSHISDEISNKCIVLNDGLGLDIISTISGSSRFLENLNGTDFTLDILRMSGDNIRIFCFGSREAVVRKAAAELADLYSLRVVGLAHGFVSKSFMDSELIDVINNSSSDVVLVGLGNTRQEEWMLAHADRLTARIIVCVGAFFDFTAGAVYRAPVWARRLRVEWFFRLVQEPSRLWRRYTIDPIVLALAALYGRLRSNYANKNSRF